MTTSERRRAIIQALYARKHETRENLAFEFRVSTRTITRDILALSFVYPIYSTSGPGGGVSIESTLYPEKDKLLSDREQALLQKLSARSTGEDKQTLLSILHKFGKAQGGTIK